MFDVHRRLINPKNISNSHFSWEKKEEEQKKERKENINRFLIPKELKNTLLCENISGKKKKKEKKNT